MSAWVLALALVAAAPPAPLDALPGSDTVGPTDPAALEDGVARAGIEVTEVDAVAPLEAAVLVDELARAIERAARAQALVVGTAAAPCPVGSPRCARVVPDLVEARVTVRLFGGLSMVRVDAVASGSKIATTRSSVDVSRDGELARAGLAELARALFPERLVALGGPVAARPPPPVVDLEAVIPPPPPPESSALTWLIVGSSGAVVLGAVGLAFGVSSSSARSSAEMSGVDAARFDVLADRAQAHGWAANGLFASAVISLAVGVIAYAVEP